MRPVRNIIASGGGGFQTSNFDLKLCYYIMAQTSRRSPRICFVTTAMGDPDAVIAALSKLAKKLGARPSHLSLFQQPLQPLRLFVLKHDMIYVGGGNTRNLLILWKAWGLDKILRVAYRRGIVLAGQSAGALCWFQSGVTDSFPGRYAPLRCLGFLRGSFCPHFDSEAKRQPVYRQLVRARVLPGGYAVEDNVALHYVNEKLVRIVSSKRRAKAHHLRFVRGSLVEEIIHPERL
jgi:dipeptidase E